MIRRPQSLSPARRTLLLLFALLLMSILAVYAFLNAGVWLVREDPLEKSRAIVVLSGGLPDRALAAAEIFRNGYAGEVWLTQPLQPSASMEGLHLPYAGEEQYDRMVLIEKGVPPAKIRFLQPKINNTDDELHAVAGAIAAEPGSTIIVVTSKAHTRRVRALWNRMPDTRARILVRAAREDYFDPEHWWRNTNDALAVVREYLGLLNAWAGLPLHHSK